jgi:hypothetical protein
MRTFIDTSGARWDVWEVRRDHVAGFGLAHHPVSPELQDGWLCFAHGRERRRLAPYPDDWRRLSLEQLAMLCAKAVVVTTGVSTLDLPPVEPPAPGLGDSAHG